MGQRVCVYSVLMGGFETLVEQPIAESSDVDFLLFTDDQRLVSQTWQIRHEAKVFPCDPSRSSRRPKILPHLVLSDYDVSVYVDNRVVLRQTPEEIVDRLLPADSVFAINAHDERPTVRDEFEAVMRWGLDAKMICAEQLEHYESSHPEVLEQRPLWTGFMVRRHNDSAVVRANEIWWTHVLRYSRRDQLSCVLALAEAGLRPTIHGLAAATSEFHEWLHPNDVNRVDSRRGKLPAVPELEECRQLLREQAAQARSQQLRLGAELATANTRLEMLEAHADRLQASRDELLESLSWRVTGPLRWLGDRAKGLRS